MQSPLIESLKQGQDYECPEIKYNLNINKMAVIEVTDLNFKEVVLDSKVPVIVDFWAPWCGPCKVLGPILEELSEELEDCVIVKCNVEDYDELAVKYSIRNIPTLLYMFEGEVKDKSVGAIRKDEIVKKLDESIKNQ